VLPATRHKWTRPALTPASKLVLDLPTPERWKTELTWATRQCTGREPNSQSLDHKSDALTTALPSHWVGCYWSPRLAKSHYCQQLTLSVCLCAFVCYTPSNCFFFFVCRWNRAIFCPPVLHVALYKTVFFDFWFMPLTPKIYSAKLSLHKIAYKSACMADRPEMFGPTGGFRGWPIQWNHAKCCGADPCCHGNEIWVRRGDQVAYRLVLLWVCCGWCEQASELEQVEKEINVSLQGIGLSLVNDKQRKEIAYMAISRSATLHDYASASCSVTRAIMFRVCLCVHPFVLLFVCVCVFLFWTLWTRFLEKHWLDLHQTSSCDAFWHRDKRFWFWGQKVGVQGHSGNWTALLGWRHTVLDVLYWIQSYYFFLLICVEFCTVIEGDMRKWSAVFTL